MRITVGPYDNIPLNSYNVPTGNGGWADRFPEGGVRKLYTRSVVCNVPGHGFIGRVDHFQKLTMKALVDAYVSQVVKRERVPGTYTIHIELEECMGEAADYRRKPLGETILIEITAEAEHAEA